MQAVSIRSAQMIYRGWGILTLVTPIAAILLLAYFFPHAGPKGNIPLPQVLLGAGIGAAVNVLLGLWLNRAPRQKGEVAPHHFFFVPMQWAALVLVAVCAVVALLR
ncbi:hypothetical protein STPA111741_07505 [Stenotrophomonas pavanii]